MAKRLFSAAIVLCGIAFLWNFIPGLYGIHWDEPKLWLYTTWVIGSTGAVLWVSIRNAIRGIKFED